MSRGQQGIGINAARIYSLLTPATAKIVSRFHPNGALLCLRIDTKLNRRHSERGQGRIEIPPNDVGRKMIIGKGSTGSKSARSAWYQAEAKYQQGQSVDEYLEGRLSLKSACHAPLYRPGRNTIAYMAGVSNSARTCRNQTAPLRNRAGVFDQYALRHETITRLRNFNRIVLPRLAGGGSPVVPEGETLAAGLADAACRSQTLLRFPKPNSRPCDRLYYSDREHHILTNCTRSCRENFCGGDSSAGGIQGNPFQVEVGLACGAGRHCKK